MHARIKLNAKDFAGAASLLDSSTIRDYTVIGDYGLWLRASALEQANRRPEARAAYEQLARDYPHSFRARDAMLHDAQLFMQDGQAAAVPVALKQLAAKDDGAALLLTAKAYEQTGNSSGALASYRRIYFFAPASAEAADAATSITRLSSTTAPANAEEASARAGKLFAAKHFSEAFRRLHRRVHAKFPLSVTPETRGTTKRHCRYQRKTLPRGDRRFERDLRRSARGSYVQSGDGLWPREAVGTGAQHRLEELRRCSPEQRLYDREHLCSWVSTPKMRKNAVTPCFISRTAVSSFPAIRRGGSSAIRSCVAGARSKELSGVFPVVNRAPCLLR